MCASPHQNQIKQKNFSNEKPVAKTTTHQYQKININTATAEDWKAFPGIGDAISNRIIKFRSSIGGFKNNRAGWQNLWFKRQCFSTNKTITCILKDSTNN